MPSYLDFDSTKNFRNYILGKTLRKNNGPQTFTASNYELQNTSDFSNRDSGGVEPTNPNLNGQRIINLYNPDEVNYIQDINVINFSEVLNLYPYFTFSEHNLIGIMSNATFEGESKLFQFAANNIKNNPQGPVLSRISRNIEKQTNGRLRILDALNGNTSTAINLITGREPLVAPNYQITTARTIAGKAVDFLENVASVTTPFSQIPGDYLSVPSFPGNEVNYRPEAKTEVGRIYQDITGALGSMIGIQRRPTRDRKPSDLLIEYTSQGQKDRLFEMIGFNLYGPNYTTTARSQNTSKIFNFVDKIAQGVKNVLGNEAPKSNAYIGDDRGDDVKLTISNQSGIHYRSPYYLSLAFDKVSADLWNNPDYNKNILQGGNIGGNFTWVRNETNNDLGVNNPNYTNQKLDDTFSTQYEFEQKSLLYKTQEILDSGGFNRTHVSNVIDQTSRFFWDGSIKISRGSAIKYVDKFTSEEAGAEYCRVWTKDNPYSNLNNTMKRTSNIRKFDGSVLGGNSRAWNLNYAPMSNGKKSFDNSTNIVSGSTLYGNGFYAKKYMFSIENLAWKTSNKAGFTVNDLPACEKGPNGGRVMWFPPYDLKVSEQNNANWDKNSFLGRPEPIYTYLDTERNGTVSFKVIVDHPSILNLLVREHFEGMNDPEADNYINSFFAGCEDLDFYELVKTYTTLDKDDLNLIKLYLNSGTSKDVIETFKYTSDPVVESNPQGGDPKKDNNTTNGNIVEKYTFYFPNDFPKKGKSLGEASQGLKAIFDDYTNNKSSYITLQKTDLVALTGRTSQEGYKDQIGIFGKSGTTLSTSIQDGSVNIDTITGKTETSFNNYIQEFSGYTKTLENLKSDIQSGYTKEVFVQIFTSTSEVATSEYNFYLGTRRVDSIMKNVLQNVANDSTKAPQPTWFTDDFLKQNYKNGIKLADEKAKFEFTFKDLGYDKEGKITINISTFGEDVVDSKGNPSNISVGGNQNINCKQVYNDKSLRVTAPQAFFCRQGSIKIDYKKEIPQSPDETPSNVPTTTLPKIKVSPDSREVTTIRPKPSIDVMKRIIMKVLSECYYFKKLEDDSPIAFNSLREKLKYFHPAFHSMTPEGLNARLTFLHQCLRPGDTIPIKGMNDERDLNARNTSFGPPPVCVLRIGDFYHSKIIIRDLNITYDDSTWDLNPEGIGVQPMLANVTLQVSFLGGHGLEKPVEKLQNALSSNFFANTEIYDERSISTTTTIGGKKAEDFTKEFLEDLVKRAGVDLNAKVTEPNSKIALGKYIGSLSNNSLDYTELIDNLETKILNYFTSYNDAINVCDKKYGYTMSPMLLHENFRTITGFTIFSGTTQSGTTNLFGEYPRGKDIGILVSNFTQSWNNKVDSTDILQIMNIDFITPDKIDDFRNGLKLIAKNSEFFDEMVNESSVKSLQNARNELIDSLDKLNYLVQYTGDTQMSGVTAYKTSLSAFTSTDFYNIYKNQIDWITTNHPRLNVSVLPVTQASYDNLDDTRYKFILQRVLLGKDEEILSLGTEVGIYVDDDGSGMSVIKLQLTDAIKTFTAPAMIEEKIISLDKFPTRTSDKKVSYELGTLNEVTDNDEKEKIRKIHRDKNNLENDKLNFYKP